MRMNERMRVAAVRMSNVLFNLKQQKSIAEHERRVMGETQEEWDAAVKEQRDKENQQKIARIARKGKGKGKKRK